MRAAVWMGWVIAAALALSGCGGGGGGESGSKAALESAPAAADAAANPVAPVNRLTVLDAKRLMDQASFGITEPQLESLQRQSAAQWLRSQMQLASSRYTSGGGDDPDRHTGPGGFCDRPDRTTDPVCWRDWYSSQPLLWDFYRNALTQPDQLRQRVAWALQQIVVVSGLQVEGTYGLREYHNMLLANAFSNWRQLLKKVSLSPVMGSYLNNVNNLRSAPNENFARELLQLFAIGTCQLNADGTLAGGACTATYDNTVVREYAFALSGWTYPPGGATSYGCWPQGANCAYYRGDMAPVQAFHDNQPRALLSGVSVPATRTPGQALELVLDSLMAHPSMAPFVSRQLIQHLVTHNPSPAYVARVSQAFTSGRYAPADGSAAFGTGARGDLAATVAATLLDAEARTAPTDPNFGRLREPVLMMTGILRALYGRSDGEALGWWWGEVFGQHVFRSPSVFNFYSPTFPLPNTSLVAPTFGIHNANTSLNRLNFLVYLLEWQGSDPEPGIPGATGTTVDIAPFVGEADDAQRLVTRLSMVALGRKLPGAAQQQVVNAVNAWTQQTAGDDWRLWRTRTAAYLIFGSSHYQVQR
jgi:uncharacterized protein (DUF1800 family)